MPVVARGAMDRDDPATSTVKFSWSLAVRKPGEGVCGVRYAGCLSHSSVPAGAVQGSPGEECAFSGVWSGVGFTELQRLIPS